MVMRDFLSRLRGGTIYGGGPPGPTPMPFMTAGPRRQAMPRLQDLPPELIAQLLGRRDPVFGGDPMILRDPPPTFRDHGMSRMPEEELPLYDIDMVPRPAPGQSFPEPRFAKPIPRRFSRGHRVF